MPSLSEARTEAKSYLPKDKRNYREQRKLAKGFRHFIVRPLPKSTQVAEVIKLIKNRDVDSLPKKSRKFINSLSEKQSRLIVRRLKKITKPGTNTYLSTFKDAQNHIEYWDHPVEKIEKIYNIPEPQAAFLVLALAVKNRSKK